MVIAYVTIGFLRNGRSLVADQPKLSKTAEEAVDDAAKRLVDSRIGVVVFQQSHDVESESYDDSIVLFKNGELPPDFSRD